MICDFSKIKQCNLRVAGWMYLTLIEKVGGNNEEGAPFESLSWGFGNIKYINSTDVRFFSQILSLRQSQHLFLYL